jgi:hypothetical protein
MGPFWQDCGGASAGSMQPLPAFARAAGRTIRFLACLSCYRGSLGSNTTDVADPKASRGLPTEMCDNPARILTGGDNPLQAWEIEWEIEQLLEKSGRELIRTFLQEWLDNLAAKEKVQVDVVGPDLDGKGVVMLHEDLREETRRRAEQSVHKLETRLSAGEKHNRKRMATVAAVYSVNAYPRAPKEIMDKEARKQPPPAPKPVDKRVWASLEHSPAEVLDEMVAEAKRRDPTGKLTWVFLVDGSDEQLRQVHKAIERHKIKALVLMDFIHILDYLWDAAWCFYKQGDPAAEEWVKQHAIDVLLGKSSDVAAGMRRSATNRGLSEAERKPLDICANHLIKNREHLRYDEALNKGMPIATGVIEGACRHLVRRRMECSGATWSLKGAEAVLRLRAVSMSGDWKEYSAYHREKEQSRNYPENAAQRLAA